MGTYRQSTPEAVKSYEEYYAEDDVHFIDDEDFKSLSEAELEAKQEEMIKMLQEMP